MEVPGAAISRHPLPHLPLSCLSSGTQPQRQLKSWLFWLEPTKSPCAALSEFCLSLISCIHSVTTTDSHLCCLRWTFAPTFCGVPAPLGSHLCSMRISLQPSVAQRMQLKQQSAPCLTRFCCPSLNPDIVTLAKGHPYLLFFASGNRYYPSTPS